MPILKSRRGGDLRDHPLIRDDTQQSVVLGLVAAKIAIAELEGKTTYGSAAQAFAAIRKRLKELTKEAQKRTTQTTALEAEKP